MSRPLLLDLFCGAGGAAVGYHRAGFNVVGVDLYPQPRYPFEFHQGDALEWADCLSYGDVTPVGHLAVDAVHASPPCQAYTVANNIHQREHPDLLPQTRDLLRDSGRPWVIENVPGAPMPMHVQVCGLALGLNVKRHRWFESSEALWGTQCPPRHPGDWLLVFGHTVLERGTVVAKAKGGGNVIRRKHTTTERGREAMGIDWMTRDELSEAIPPAYTEYIGRQLIEHLERAA